LPPACQVLATLHSWRHPSYIVSIDFADCRRSSIRNWEDLDQIRVLDCLGLGSGEKRLQINIPICTEPDQALYRDYAPNPNKGPLGASNMLIVELGSIEVSKKDGPNAGERPNVGM
jgi:hypothetical protein